MVDVSEKFGKTDVGRFTMILVAWKVVGKDVVRIFLGLVFIIVITILMLKIYRNMFMPKKILNEYSNPGFLKFPKIKKYEVVKPNDNWDGYQFVKIFFVFLYAGAIGLTYAIMFA